MKLFISVFLLLFAVSWCFPQTIHYASVTRWYFNGVPNIQGLTTIKDNGTPSKIWFAEMDSHKVAYVTLKMCKTAPIIEYNVAPIYPYKIAYAEKAFNLTAQRTKYASSVWFTTSTYTDSLYSIVTDKKGAYLIGYPSGSPEISPSLIRWQVKDKHATQKLWFTNGNYNDNNLYSFEPVNTGGTFPAIVTDWTLPDTGSVTTLRVENGYIWSTVDDGNGNIFLYAKSTTGTSARRWAVGTLPGIGERDLITVYNKTMPKFQELPSQVWIAGELGLAIIKLQPTDTGAPDSLCTTFLDPQYNSRGLFSCPASMRKNTQNWTFYLTNQQNDSDFISALRAAPSRPIQRTTVTLNFNQENVNGVKHPITVSRNQLKFACTTVNIIAPPLDCLTDDYRTQYNATTGFNFFSALGPIDMVGKTSGTNYDILFYEPVTTVSVGTYTSTLDWVSGKYTAFTPITASMNEKQPATIQGNTKVEFALHEAYPNPFNPTTVISYSLPATSIVTLKVYNMLGQEVATLADQKQMGEGEHQVEFNASSLPSGTYLYRITAKELGDNSKNGVTHTDVKKLLLMK